MTEIEKAKNQYDAEERASRGVPTRTQVAKEAGLSKDQAVTAIRVARVPEEEFEAAVESEDPPTVTALLVGCSKKGFLLGAGLPLLGSYFEGHVRSNPRVAGLAAALGSDRHVTYQNAVFGSLSL